MANSPLGVYWSVEHRRQEDYSYFKALQPAAHLIMDGGVPDYTFVRDNQPNTTVLARDWALSEQHSDMLRDPVGTGDRHAHEWNDHQAKLGFDRAKTLILGINEPQVWQPGVPEALRKYTITLCESATALGLRVGAMQLGVGWPGNNGPDTPPDWSPFDGVEAAIKRNGGALICHEYWADKGPSENLGWWAGRTLKCPWQVPIIIGECGVDMFVKDTSVGQQNRGWVGHMPPERYANELWEYTNRMAADPRFVGCCVFASDFQNREWFSFDVKPAYNAILGVKPADASPVTVHLPAIDNGPSEPQPTGDNWERSVAWVLDHEGGFQNNPNDVGNYYNGQLIGTKYGISAASWAGQYDIPNLTIDQAKQIYFDHYWKPAGADKLAWPECLLVLDTDVLHGSGTSATWRKEVGNSPFAFAAKRLNVYTHSDKWQYFGAGWVNRVASLLDEVGKP